MSYETPILTAGNPSNQTIWEAVTDPRHTVGTRAQLNDGRSFYYSCNRGIAINCGNVIAAEAAVSTSFDDLAVNTAQVGDTTVNVTPTGSATYAKNQLEGGFLSINSGAAGNEGRQYRIMGNPATTAATAFDLTIEPIREEAFIAATTATVVPNLWSSVVASPVGVAVCVGLTTFDVPAGSTDPQYFWAQTWGMATALSGTNADIVGHVLRKSTGGLGETLGFVDAAADVNQFLGVNFITSVDADYMPIMLTIAP